MMRVLYETICSEITDFRNLYRKLVLWTSTYFHKNYELAWNAEAEFKLIYNRRTEPLVPAASLTHLTDQPVRLDHE